MRIHLCGRLVQALAAAEQPGVAGGALLELMKQRTGAHGGVIMIDREGRIGWARSTHSMAYAASWENHEVVGGS
jgi:isoaspartyl peptidase/L-asparaginase-like protein (Ntn-hydrolase superfamily)